MGHPDMPSVRGCLGGMHYPCHRAELVEYAAAHGAGDDVLGALGGLPDRRYGSTHEVCSSITEGTSS